MDVLAWCQWIQDSSIGSGIRESAYAFPVIETIHVLALAIAIGTIVWFDLRLIGVSMRRDRVSEVFAQLRPFMFIGFALMVGSGILLFWSHAADAYNSVYFRVKIGLLVLAAVNVVVFHTTIDRRRHEWDLDDPPPFEARVAGYLSLALWMAVIAAGRLTAYNL